MRDNPNENPHEKDWERVLAMGQRFAADLLTDHYEPMHQEGDRLPYEQELQELREEPLSVMVRDAKHPDPDCYWLHPHEVKTPSHYELLLSTGGPAMRVVGQLDCYGEPCTACVEVQDWFKPWTEITTTTPAQDAALLWFASLFSYGAGA